MTDCGCDPARVAQLERNTLWTLLAINGAMFVVEGLAGWWSESMGVLADSLDMLADAAVYGTALYAVGRSERLQARAATASGFLQILLGALVLMDVVRRFVYGSDPVSTLMVLVGAVALVANTSCLLLLAKHRAGGVHMRASWIFSTNDVLANIGVIVSGLLVMLSGSRLPDLLIGAIISTAVVSGGLRILREAGREPDHGVLD